MVSVTIHDFSQAVKPGESTGIIEVRGHTVKQFTVEGVVEGMEAAFDVAAAKIGKDKSASHNGLALLGNAVFLLRAMYDLCLQGEKEGGQE